MFREKELADLRNTPYAESSKFVEVYVRRKI